MSLSKPIINLFGKYLSQLYLHPYRTRAISRYVLIFISFKLIVYYFVIIVYSSIIALCGNLASQYLNGNKRINENSTLAFALFG